MTFYKYLMLLSLSMILFTSCKQEAKEKDSVETEIAPVTFDGLTKTTQDANIPDLLIESTLIDNDWEIEIFMESGVIDKEHKWLEAVLSFKPDHSYNWSGKESHKGTWEIDSNKSILLLTASKEDQSTEWTVKHKKSMMVWVGTANYGLNAVQMKLNRIANGGSGN